MAPFIQSPSNQTVILFGKCKRYINILFLLCALNNQLQKHQSLEQTKILCPGRSIFLAASCKRTNCDETNLYSIRLHSMPLNSNQIPPDIYSSTHRWQAFIESSNSLAFDWMYPKHIHRYHNGTIVLSPLVLYDILRMTMGWKCRQASAMPGVCVSGGCAVPCRWLIIEGLRRVSWSPGHALGHPSNPSNKPTLAICQYT